jgi:hypothetical protein
MKSIQCVLETYRRVHGWVAAAPGSALTAKTVEQHGYQGCRCVVYRDYLRFQTSQQRNLHSPDIAESAELRSTYDLLPKETAAMEG